MSIELGFVLQHDAVAVRILERATVAIPVWVERRYRGVTRLFHSVNGPLPRGVVGQVENKQMIPRGRPAGNVPGFACEFQMVSCVRCAESDAVEAIVIAELAEHVETEAVAEKATTAARSSVGRAMRRWA